MSINFSKKIYLIFLFTINLLVAQKDMKANLIYKIEMFPKYVEDINNMEDVRERMHMQKVLSEIDGIKLTLKLDANGSYFGEIEKMKVDRSNYEIAFRNLALSYAGISDSYYVDNQKKALYEETDALGDKMLVVLEYKKNWEIEEGNTKEIMGYTCHKATYQKEMVSRGKVSYRKIEAWFTYDIKYPYGPKDHIGLPGVILEVKDGLATLSCIDIIWDKNIVIEKPNKNIQVLSKEEYDKLIRAYMLELYPK